MLLNNKYLFLLFFIPLFMLNACSKKAKKEDINVLLKKYNSQGFLIEKVREVLGENVSFAVKGNFDNKNNLEIAAAKEINETDTSGIQFFLLELKETELSVISSTKVLRGSLTKSLTNKIKFPFFNYELLYYNSNNYYMGSRGGEQFSYIINFKENETYYSHVVSAPKKLAQIYISKNIKRKEIKNFFISNAKRDFPNIRVSVRDMNLDDNNL
ncbi:MAG TPA: hypothetical protein ENI57_11110 [Ignavibacteria bacterium]|nr:hypothetical protein [Ignavibacteria bacterium]